MAEAVLPGQHRGTRAVQRMVEFAPSTGGLALWVQHRDLPPDRPGPTIATDGHTVWYGPAFEKLPLAEQTGLIGPLVLPGATSCLNCADLHRSDRDASWPALAAQLEGTVGSGDRATVLATAAVPLVPWSIHRKMGGEGTLGAAYVGWLASLAVAGAGALAAAAGSSSVSAVPPPPRSSSPPGSRRRAADPPAGRR